MNVMVVYLVIGEKFQPALMWWTYSQINTEILETTMLARSLKIITKLKYPIHETQSKTQGAFTVLQTHQPQDRAWR